MFCTTRTKVPCDTRFSVARWSLVIQNLSPYVCDNTFSPSYAKVQSFIWSSFLGMSHMGRLLNEKHAVISAACFEQLAWRGRFEIAFFVFQAHRCVFVRPHRELTFEVVLMKTFVDLWIDSLGLDMVKRVSWWAQPNRFHAKWRRMVHLLVNIEGFSNEWVKSNLHNRSRTAVGVM